MLDLLRVHIQQTNCGVHNAFMCFLGKRKAARQDHRWVDGVAPKYMFILIVSGKSPSIVSVLMLNFYFLRPQNTKTNKTLGDSAASAAAASSVTSARYGVSSPWQYRRTTFLTQFNEAFICKYIVFNRFFFFFDWYS